MFQIVSFESENGPVVGLRQGDDYYASSTFSSVREMVDQWPLVIKKLATAGQRTAEPLILWDRHPAQRTGVTYDSQDTFARTFQLVV